MISPTTEVTVALPSGLLAELRLHDNGNSFRRRFPNGTATILDLILAALPAEPLPLRVGGTARYMRGDRPVRTVLGFDDGCVNLTVGDDNLGWQQVLLSSFKTGWVVLS